MIRKIHEFLIEADITVEEWMAACNLMVQAGKVSSDARNEVVLVTDVFGIESLVGECNDRLSTDAYAERLILQIHWTKPVRKGRLKIRLRA